MLHSSYSQLEKESLDSISMMTNQTVTSMKNKYLKYKCNLTPVEL